MNITSFFSLSNNNKIILSLSSNMDIKTNNFLTTSNDRRQIRYGLAKKMMNENFLKWINQKNNLNLIKQLIEECKKPLISLVCNN